MLDACVVQEVELQLLCEEAAVLRASMAAAQQKSLRMKEQQELQVMLLGDTGGEGPFGVHQRRVRHQMSAAYTADWDPMAADEDGQSSGAQAHSPATTLQVCGCQLSPQL